MDESKGHISLSLNYFLCIISRLTDKNGLLRIERILTQFMIFSKENRDLNLYYGYKKESHGSLYHSAGIRNALRNSVHKTGPYYLTQVKQISRRDEKKVSYSK